MFDKRTLIQWEKAYVSVHSWKTAMKTYSDLRDFLFKVEEMGELKRIQGADWDLEIGGITEVAANLNPPPALLFESIKGVPNEYRLCSNTVRSTKRCALALNIDPVLSPVSALNEWRNRRKSYSPVRPKEVSDGPVTENILEGDMIDIEKFPSPRWHENDGGRYLGSGAITVMQDPEEGWVNLAIYRIMVHDKSMLALHVDHPGRHGAIIAQKYWTKNKNCPVAIICGADPALFLASAENLAWGSSEYDFAGWIKSSPVPVMRGKATDLPVPSNAEIIIEGEIPPVETLSLPEGPFGEFTGYYASGVTPAFAVKVKRISHRDKPILSGEPPLKPPAATLGLPLPAGSVWNDIESTGISDVKGVWQHVYRMFTVISIKQRYSGHAVRAGLVAASSSSSGYIGRIVVVVDDDIDVTKVGDVLWAIATRCEPSEDINIINGGWSSSLDPRLLPKKKAEGNYTNSKIIIIACKPFSWMKDYPKENRMSETLRLAIERKWLPMLSSSS